MAKNKKERKRMTKQSKRALIMGVVLILILALFITGFSIVKNNGNVFTSAITLLMPKTYDYEKDGKKITFYAEKNKDFDAKKDQPLEAFVVYYYADNGKKVVLENGEYPTGEKDEKGKEIKDNIILNFLVSIQSRYKTLQSVLSGAIAVYIILVILYLIYLWYLNWSKRYDKKQAQLRQNNKEE